eukprot:TRINITY_DN2461_c0_g1_i1.p1 TRINITY_DN2461_c0_g1~~TRINITY_DN2461_c0_g1_i1.p1  ORF type:complete len:260 (-),score=56.09 TRINITY_DN2461_c0_g1_i1:22-747(-)
MSKSWFGGSSNTEKSATEAFYPELPTPKTKEDFIEITKTAYKQMMSINDEYMQDDGGYEAVSFPTAPDIQIWVKQLEDSSAPCIVTVGDLPATANEIKEIVLASDIKEIQKWNPECLDKKVLKEVGDGIQVIYLQVKAQFPVSNRDACVLSRVIVEDDGRIVICTTSINYESCSAVNGFVRSVSKVSGWILDPLDGGKCMVTRMLHTDPKGLLPTFLLNFFKTRPAQSLVFLREILAQKKK